MVAIQVLSDLHLLHLEAPKSYNLYEIVPAAPYLALLGDVGNIEKHKSDCLAFLTKQLKQFSAVLFVPGNHEAYGSSWPATLAVLQAFEDDVSKNPLITGRFILADRRTYKVPSTGVAIVGCSLFSQVPPENAADVELGLRDFSQTDEWNLEAHNAAHQRDLAWLNEEVETLEQSEEVERADCVSLEPHARPSGKLAAARRQQNYGGVLNRVVAGGVLYKSQGQGLGVWTHALQLRFCSGTGWTQALFKVTCESTRVLYFPSRGI